MSKNYEYTFHGICETRKSSFVKRDIPTSIQTTSDSVNTQIPFLLRSIAQENTR